MSKVGVSWFPVARSSGNVGVMEHRDDATGTVLDDTVLGQNHLPLEERRPCTRCDGEQHLVASHGGMGKYRCDTCQLVVGFDLSASQAEFLLSRGLPSRYTKDRFSSTILGSERRL